MNSQEYRALVNRLEAIQEAGTPQADATPEPQPAPGPQDPGSADYANQMDQSSDAVTNGSAPGSDTPAVYDASPGQIPSAEEMKNMDIGFGPGKFLPDNALSPEPASGTPSGSIPLINAPTLKSAYEQAETQNLRHFKWTGTYTLDSHKHRYADDAGMEDDGDAEHVDKNDPFYNVLQLQKRIRAMQQSMGGAEMGPGPGKPMPATSMPNIPDMPSMPKIR